jgi:hypothetical protein
LGGSSGEQTRINARTPRAVLAQLVLVAGLVCWMEATWSIPPFGPVGFASGVVWLALDLTPSAVIFLVMWRFVLGRTIEWTVAGNELRRRSWLSRPGGEPSRAAALGQNSEAQHQTRNLWRVWPAGSEIRMWPGQTAALVRAMQGAGAHVDDFRGDWERGHQRLNRLAIVAYCFGIALVFIATPAVAVAAGEGVPLLSLAGGVVAIALGEAIDRQPWKVSETATRIS